VNLSKSNYQTHLCFIFLIAIHYLVSIIFVGEIIVEPHDNLDITVVGDHIISKIYKGDFASIGYFLSGEIKWYYFEKLFYPINILHYILDDKLFYFTNDILKKLIPYFSFYLLAKYLKISRFNSALAAVLYSTILYIDSPLGLGMAFLPYILYLLLKKNSLDKKHYFVLFFIGLNSALLHDFFSFIFLIPLTFILKTQNRNLKIYIQIFSVIFIACILSNIHLIVGTVFGETIQRVEWVTKEASILASFLGSFKYLFHINFAHPLFIFHIPLALLSLTLFILAILSKQKNIRLTFLFIIFIIILKIIMNYNIIDNLFIVPFEFLKGYNFSRVLSRITPLLLVILFIFLISNLKYKKLKNFLYFLSILSIISVQIKIPTPVITQYLLKKNMSTEKFEEIKKNFVKKNYINFIKIVFDKNNYVKNNMSFKNSTNKTFDNYYMFKEYAYIKNIVKDSRVMSVGLDPMVAVMNDIRVIDGYHTIYPLSYKIKFRKIIEKELDKNINFKNYYDLWGSRVYAFHNDKNNILLNFQVAKKLKAEYIISRFPIKNNELENICVECNNTNYLFLYKIL